MKDDVEMVIKWHLGILGKMEAEFDLNGFHAFRKD